MFRSSFVKVLTPVLALIALSFSSLSFSYSSTGTASVELIESVKFEERKFIDYGRMVNENGSCALTQSGALQGTNGSSCNGNGQVGEFVISGAKDQQISISVSGGESLSGVTFTPELHSSSLVTLADGMTVAKVGGTLDLNDADMGRHTLSYTISVNYE